VKDKIFGTAWQQAHTSQWAKSQSLKTETKYVIKIGQSGQT